MDTEQTTPKTLTITLTEHEPNTLFLRQVIASGEAADGTRISVEQAGERVLLRHTAPEGAVTLHSFLMSDAVQTWAAQLEESTPEPVKLHDDEHPDDGTEGDALIAAYEAAQAALRAHAFPALVEEEVTDDGETFMALRCPRCNGIVSDGDLYAVIPAEHWAPNEYPDDDAFDHHRITFDSSERPDLEETLYYRHGDDPGHAVSLPVGWREDWVL